MGEHNAGGDGNQSPYLLQNSVALFKGNRIQKIGFLHLHFKSIHIPCKIGFGVFHPFGRLQRLNGRILNGLDLC